jgi:integrase/recombinase XerC
MLSVNPPAPLATFDQDILTELLWDKRSPNTRRTYAKGLKDFFVTMIQAEPSPERIAWFLSLGRFEAISLVLRYRAGLLERGLAPASINVRLAAVKSLVNYARKIGKCEYSLEDVEGLRAETYRDTTGVSPEIFKQIAAQVQPDSLKGKRDAAILRLLWDNALRRAEVCFLNLEDYQSGERSLLIKGKGQLTKEAIRLSDKAVLLIDDWLAALSEVFDPLGEPRSGGEASRSSDSPLFCTVDRATFGHRLSGNVIYNLVRDSATAAGIEKVMSPHRVRHSAITAALDATNGDTRKVRAIRLA